MKTIALILTIILFFGLAFNAMAGEKHHTQTTTNYANIKGVASAIALGQHNFDWSTKSWQGSASVGAYDSTTAFSFGLAKRFNKTLISGSVSEENGKIGGGASVRFQF